MSSRKLQWTLSLVVVAIAVLMTISHLWLRSAIGTRLTPQLCLPMYSADVVCYTKVEKLIQGMPTAIAVSPNGEQLAASEENTIQRWNLKTLEPLEPLLGHAGLISAIAISPDGRTLASSSLDNTTRLWDLQFGAQLGTVPIAGRTSVLAFSPDGQILATASRVKQWADGSSSPVGVQFWDVPNRRFLFQLGDQPVQAIAFSPDGAYFAAGGKKTAVWSLKTGELIHNLNAGDLTSVVFTKEQPFLITGSGKTRLWDLINGAEIQTFNVGALDLSLSPDERTLAVVVGGTVRFWQLPTDLDLGYLRGSWYSSLFAKFALQGRAIVAASSEGVKIWQSIAATEERSQEKAAP
jgi:WD40 repeat protein